MSQEIRNLEPKALWDKFADLNEIKVLRATNTSTEVLSVKYESLLNGKELSSNIQLQASDIIVVP